MALQVPPNSTGQVIETLTKVSGKEMQMVMTNAATPGSGNAYYAASTPATATQATVTAPAVAGARNVCTGITVALQSIGTIQPVIQVNLRDGATGAGTILWSIPIGLAVSSYFSTYYPVRIAGSVNTAMTLEFSAAGAAATSEGVSIEVMTTS